MNKCDMCEYDGICCFESDEKKRCIYFMPRVNRLRLGIIAHDLMERGERFGAEILKCIGTFPDSWESIKEDLDKEPCEYFGGSTEKCSGCVIEDCIEDCETVKFKNLVCRCLELAR